MCAQCWATAGTAVTATGGAVGIRVWLASKRPGWLTSSRMKAMTAALVVFALCASSLRIA
jgi:hypothetical protein